MKTTYYTFKVNGEQRVLSVKEALAIGTDEITKQLKDIEQANRNKRRVRDGFQAGFQENIGVNCWTRRGYEQELKARGLVEIGNDYIPQDTTVTSNPFASDEAIKSAIESGIELSGQEIDGLKSGSLLKDVSLE